MKRIDDVLGDALREVESSDQSSQRKRERSKRAIYAAGVVLAQELYNIKKKETPKHVLGGQVIGKLEKQAKIAKELKAWKGGPFRYPLKIKARGLRRERMTPAQYISVVKDRIATLRRSHEYQRNLELAQKARRGFVERPSVRTIQKQERRAEPNVEHVGRFYKRAYSSATETDRRPTPRFNKWPTRLSNYRQSAVFKQRDPEKLELHAIRRKGKPKHVLVGQVIRKLEKQVKIAKELKTWKGGPFRYFLKIKARELRRGKITSAQYIPVVEDRINTLRRSSEY